MPKTSLGTCLATEHSLTSPSRHQAKPTVRRTSWLVCWQTKPFCHVTGVVYPMHPSPSLVSGLSRVAAGDLHNIDLPGLGPWAT